MEFHRWYLIREGNTNKVRGPVSHDVSKKERGQDVWVTH